MAVFVALWPVPRIYSILIFNENGAIFWCYCCWHNYDAIWLDNKCEGNRGDDGGDLWDITGGFEEFFG